MAQDLQAAVAHLYGVPLDAFVAERTRVARALKAAGQRDAAAEVAGLAKPSAAAWALNHVAREAPEAVAEWADAAAALRDASTRSAQVGGDTVRAAMAGHRASTGRLVGAVHELAQPGGRPLSPAMLDRVSRLLHAATADAGLAERLQAGCVTEEPAPAAVSPPAAAVPPSAAASPSAAVPPAEVAPPADGPARDREAEARAERRAELELRERHAAQAAERLRDQLARRHVAAQAAEERLEQARRTLLRSESEAAAAHDAVKDAEHAAAEAVTEVDDLRAQLRQIP